MAGDEVSAIKSVWNIVKPLTEVKIHKGVLNANSVNQLISDIGFPYDEQASIVLDLKKLTDINAVGLLGLVLILIELLRENASVLIYRPLNQYFDN